LAKNDTPTPPGVQHAVALRQAVVIALIDLIGVLRALFSFVAFHEWADRKRDARFRRHCWELIEVNRRELDAELPKLESVAAHVRPFRAIDRPRVIRPPLSARDDKNRPDRESAHPLLEIAMIKSSLASLIISGACMGQVLVEPGASIQDAIDGIPLAGAVAFEIQVGPGFYVESLDFGARNIRLIGTEGANATFISADPNAGGSVISIQDNPGNDILIKGFTLANGTGTWRSTEIGSDYLGGGVFVSNSDVEIEDCNIWYNSAEYGGGLAASSGAHISINNCDIRGNEVMYSGGGILIETYSDVAITNSIIQNNVVKLFVGGGIAHFAGSLDLDGCDLVSNHAEFGGGIYINDGGTTNTTIRQSTICSNTVDNIQGLWVDLGSTQVVVDCECFSDITNDGVVDVMDFIALMTNWNQSDSDVDTNGDGIVDIVDLINVFAAWGPCLHTG